MIPYVATLFLLSGSSITARPLRTAQAKNNAPKVSFIEPLDNSVHSLNELLRYSVSVSDPEDGDTKYDEIPPAKVFLEVKFVDGSPPKDSKKRLPAWEPLALSLMKNSDCFTCHGFKSKMIGPSFLEIAKRYTNSDSNRKALASRVSKGSTRIWSELVMPTHPDLSSGDAEKIVDWILTNGADSKLDYLTGKEGTIRLQVPDKAKPGYFVFTASYTDDGLGGTPGQRFTGRDVILVRYK
jgi:cytochrome c